MEEPLSGLRYALVGPGRVGRSLIGWMQASGAELIAVASRASGREVCESIRTLAVEAMESRDLDLLLVAVPDPVLPAVVERLSARRQAAVVLHTSGRRGASVLAPLRAVGSRVGCLHPLRAFARPLPDPEVARQTFLGLGGDPEAIALGQRLADSWGAPHGVIPDEARNLYHLAATLSAGGVATILALASTIARAKGLPLETLDGYRLLAEGAIEAAAPSFEARSITGPAARAELGYVEQLEELTALDPALLPAIREIALATLELLDREDGDDARRTALRERLRSLGTATGS